MASTSWGKVAGWYDEVVEEKGSYQRDVVLPNLLRIMDIKGGEKILDLACGQGFFSGEFLAKGADVVASDISEELIFIAKNNSKNNGIKFFVSPADNIKFLEEKSVDKIAVVLAIQNIENIGGVLKECSRVLKDGGKIYFVLNHPAFRIPKESSWGYDEEENIQYRRMDAYLSESRIKIDMNPGERNAPKNFTISFHRPLQLYSKVLRNNGFCINTIEEWVSDKKSQSGPRQKAEDKARKEFPMFMIIEAIKINK
ncbi:MAG: class I SAM-dependent methyltransferase [bacterium]